MGPRSIGVGVVFCVALMGSAPAAELYPVPDRCLSLAAQYGLPDLLTKQQAKAAVLQLRAHLKRYPNDQQALACAAEVRQSTLAAQR